ncbi:MAG: hypothetical protein KAV87_66330 [Desulfobacteraceae bacterium]|nr:hypothetical protein [Desulfobacteraceae bacterium]
MPKKASTKTTPKTTGRRRSDEPVPIPPNEDESIDWSSYMFGGYNADLDKVSLYRTSPKEHLGVPTYGWLEDLGPGVDENYIRENFGGGRFQLNKRNRQSGKITASCTFDIAGFPKVAKASAGPEEDGENRGVAAPAIMLDVAGAQVPYTEDLGKLTDFVMAMKAIKAVFPDPAPPIDVNAALLELVLKRDSVTESLEAIRALKEVAGVAEHSTETGSNVYDLLKATIEQAGPVMRAMVSPPVKRFPGMVPALPGPDAGSAPGNGPGKQPVAVPETSENESVSNTNERGPMSQRELLLSVASTIMACWKLDPPKNVTETVVLIDLVLQQGDSSIRKGLVDRYSETMLSICEAGLAEEWILEESSVGGRKEFGEFFAQVFTEYERADREVMSL